MFSPRSYASPIPIWLRKSGRFQQSWWSSVHEGSWKKLVLISVTGSWHGNPRKLLLIAETKSAGAEAGWRPNEQRKNNKKALSASVPFSLDQKVLRTVRMGLPVSIKASKTIAPPTHTHTDMPTGHNVATFHSHSSLRWLYVVLGWSLKLALPGALISTHHGRECLPFEHNPVCPLLLPHFLLTFKLLMTEEGHRLNQSPTLLALWLNKFFDIVAFGNLFSDKIKCDSLSAFSLPAGCLSAASGMVALCCLGF